MSVIKMTDLSLQGQRVLIRQDLNVPIKAGKVSSDARIVASLPTIKRALADGAKVMLMSHLGRPTEGEFNPEFSLQPVVDYLNQVLDVPVRLVTDYLNGVEVNSAEVVVLENVRFNHGEKANDSGLSQQLAALCDVYVMDAFGTAHRAQASTHGVAQYATVACAGPLLANELTALSQALDNPKRPLVAIVGGSKVSTKLTVLNSLSSVVDQLVVGGGIANTFIAAAGHNVGKSLYEADLISEAQNLLAQTAIPIPTDVVTAKEFDANADGELKSAAEVTDDDMIFDIGPESVAELAQILKQAGTIVWNGPVGVFEFKNFAAGTQAIAEAIANSEAFSIAGGGDTLAAIDQFGIAADVSYISTGGGAFLEFLEGKVLPAVEVLEQRAAAS